jgi:DNA-binding MarR family transcriptional regulator
VSATWHRRRISLLFQIFRTSELNAKLVSRALAPAGVRGDDFAVYSYLFYGPMNLTELADGTGMPLTTVSGYVKRFEARGHVLRQPNPNDGRSQLLSLTGSGRDWLMEAVAIFRKTTSHLYAVLDAEDVDPEQLIDELQGVQVLIERTLKELDDPG